MSLPNPAGVRSLINPAAVGGRGWIENGIVEIDDGDSPYTVLDDDVSVFADATSAAVEVDLPADPIDGRLIAIRNVGDGSFAVTVDGNGNNVEGGSTDSLAGAGDGFIYQFTGTQWRAIASV